MTNATAPLEEPPVPGMSSLPRDLEPPAALEDRVVSALGAHALVGRRDRTWRWQHIAAAVVLFALGAVAGRLSAPERTPATAGQPRFLLLLSNAPSTGPDDERVDAYRAWARTQRAAGREISGERLAPEGRVVEPGGTTSPERDDLQGFFVVSGASLDDAAAVARSSPHVQSGGRVLVRAIDTP